MSENVVRLLHEHLGTVPAPLELPRGHLRRLPAALNRAAMTHGVNRTWTATTDELDLATYLDHCDRAGAITAYRWAITTGHAWSYCDTCGEPIVVNRRDTTERKCRMTPGCDGTHRPPVHGGAPSR